MNMGVNMLVCITAPALSFATDSKHSTTACSGYEIDASDDA